MGSNGNGRDGARGDWPAQRSAGDWEKRIGTALVDSDRIKLAKDFASVRIKSPGAMFTMDFVPDRLNVNVDDGGVILGFSWG